MHHTTRGATAQDGSGKFAECSVTVRAGAASPGAAIPLPPGGIVDLATAKNVNHQNAVPSFAAGTSARDKFLAIAKSQIGYTSGWPTSGGKIKFPYTGHDGWTKYRGSTGAWCDAFVNWCARKAGAPTSAIPGMTYVPTIRQVFVNAGRFYSNDNKNNPLKPGDLIFMGNSKYPADGHIALCCEVNRDSKGKLVDFVIVEGNTLKGVVREAIWDSFVIKSWNWGVGGYGSVTW